MREANKETYNALLLLEEDDFVVELLQPVLQVVLVFQNGHFVFLLDSQLHLAHLQSLLKGGLLRLEVDAALFLLASGLIALVQIVMQVLNLLLLLPEDLSELVRCVTHVLQHVAQFSHGFCRLVEHLSASCVVQAQLVDLLAMSVDFALVLLDSAQHVLRLQLGRAPLVLNHV